MAHITESDTERLAARVARNAEEKLDKKSIDARKLSVPIPLIISIMISVFPAVGLWSVAMYRLGNAEMRLDKHSGKIEKNEGRLNAHDIELNSQGKDMHYIKTQVDKAVQMLEDIQKNK